MGRRKGLTSEQWGYILAGLASQLTILSGMHTADIITLPVILGFVGSVLSIVGGTLAKTSKDSKP